MTISPDGQPAGMATYRVIRMHRGAGCVNLAGMGRMEHRNRLRRLAQHLSRLDDRDLSRRWAALLAPLVGESSDELMSAPRDVEGVISQEEAMSLRAENDRLRHRIEVLLRTVDDLARR